MVTLPVAVANRPIEVQTAPHDEEGQLLKPDSPSPPRETGCPRPDGFQVPEPAFRSARAAPPILPVQRPVLLVCGDLHNVGDLALAAQSIFLARARGTPVVVRTWGAPPDSAVAQIGQWGASWMDGRRLFPLLRQARASDLVFAGGELVRANIALRSLALLLLAVLVVRANGGRITARGLGVGRVTGLRALLWRLILARMSHIAVRDARSADAVRSILPGAQPVHAADMAFLGNRLVDMARTRKSQHPGAIVIAPCIDASEQRTLDRVALSHLIGHARQHFPDAPLVFACHDPRPGMDCRAAERLMTGDLAPATMFDGGGDMCAVLALYREASLVITNRLHAGIFATLHDRPLLLLHDGNAKLDFLVEEFGAAALRPAGGTGPREAIAQALRSDGGRRRTARLAAASRAEGNLPRHRTAIFNVKYSPNLGDGVIAECLEGELRRVDAGIEPVSLDMAGRTAFHPGHGRYRRLVLALLELVPRQVRARIVPAVLAPLVRHRQQPRWRRALHRCDSVVVGGGALFADADQNFPIKIAAALDVAAAFHLPVAVASVGVSRGWSEAGRQRMAQRLGKARLASVSVRDRESLGAWESLFAQSCSRQPELAPDPGLLSARQYGPVDRPAGSRPRVGLCVTAPLALRLHHDDNHNEDQLAAWYRTSARELVQRGCEVRVFTNGSPEDRQFRDRLVQQSRGRDGIDFHPDFATPSQLAHFIAGLDCVLAHRLHACIVAYSYRVPAVGFAWDNKLRAFFEQSGRDDFVLDPRDTPPRQLVDMAFSAMDRGIDRELHAVLLGRASTRISDLADCLLLAGRGA